MLKKIICYGIGQQFESFLKLIDFEHVQIVALADKYCERAKKRARDISEDIQGILPRQISGFEFDYVIVCSELHEDEMLYCLQENGILYDKIACWTSALEKPVEGYLDRFFDKYQKKEFHNKEILSQLMRKDIPNKIIIRDMLNLHRSRYLKDFYKKVKTDYVRISTIELLAAQIKKRGIVGEMAELGVYQGNISSLLNEMFPEKKLYLFDTFDGFDASDHAYDIERRFTRDETKQFFKDTSIEKVMERMEAPEKCIVKKGFFPESLGDMRSDMTLKFSIVSIDPDLYMPTYEGIKYFYPRLSKGGYIIVHDYECPTFGGARQAIENACRELNISFVPISDENGSVVITK